MAAWGQTGFLGVLAGVEGPWAYATRSLALARRAARLQGCSRGLRSRAGGACCASEHCGAFHLLKVRPAQEKPQGSCVIFGVWQGFVFSSTSCLLRSREL